MPTTRTKHDEAVSSGLALFAPGTSPAKRRRRLLFLAVYILAAALLIWPVYPMFSGIEPMILGLPLSFAWVILALLVMFGALLLLFRADERETNKDCWKVWCTQRSMDS